MPDGAPELVSDIDVAHLARLARLVLAADDLALFTRQLGDIVRFTRQVQSVDTAGVSPATHPGDATAAEPAEPLARADVARPGLCQSDALANAPGHVAGDAWFRVPRVIGS